MNRAVSGSLISLDVMHVIPLDASARLAAARVRDVLAAAFCSTGPASSARGVADAQVVPLFHVMGFDLALTRDSSAEIVGTLRKHGRASANVAIGAWGSDLWRLVTLAVPKHEERFRWSLVLNGATLRIADRSRLHARRALDVDLQQAAEDDAALGILVRLLDADEEGRFETLERCVVESDAHRARVGTSLQRGVEQALGHLIAALAPARSRGATALDAALADALTIVYRVLFLLFAEARGLVPQWHPIYRNSYTIEALRPRIERTSRPPGVWQALQAISRLAHRGCRAGTLRVTPFNGRLFAPAAAPLAESVRIDDRHTRDALLAITTRQGRDRRERISYADLGVEQLGAVYERVLDYSPEVEGSDVVLSRSGRRKATGTFYTPRSLTEFLVRRTLAPLVRGRTTAEILAVRIVDPAMGSGAFLVAACRYLADAYEQAGIAEGRFSSTDLGQAERAHFRRVIAQRCLYGVDRNPTAVQLARLSLWLCTLAADRPLTFLDHHLRAGNSLAGAAPHDIMRQPPGPSFGARPKRVALLPLFADDTLQARIGASIAPRMAMALEEDSTADIVRRKEQMMVALDGDRGPLAGWRTLADAWCAGWFWPEDRARLDPRAWGSLCTALRGQSSGLPPELARDWLTTVRQVVEREHFFHWALEFPEVFFDADGQPLERGGFDAVLGNPPWDTLRDSGDDTNTTGAARALTRFSRDSGCYKLQSEGHANLYQLFTERALQLVKPGGRVGLLLPSGLLTDHGCVRLRTALLERSRIDALLSFDNRLAIFPIHRGVRFALLTADADGVTSEVAALTGLTSPSQLDEVPDEGRIPGSVGIPVALIRKLSGSDLAFPELHTDLDRRVVARILASAPPLGDASGWNCHFGRELNATDDRRHFSTHGLPVLEGKLLEPFRVNVTGASSRIRRDTVQRLLGHRVAFSRPRLGYREVAASTNRLTLIAAIVPADTVTTHTVFCLKGTHDMELQWFLCGVFNSFVANYLVRLRGATHVTAATMRQLPVPKPPRESEAFGRVAALARALSSSDADAGAHAELQGQVARLYELDGSEFDRVLSTFPLVASEIRDACARALRRMMDAV